jgi:hypothetical protein
MRQTGAFTGRHPVSSRGGSVPEASAGATGSIPVAIHRRSAAMLQAKAARREKGYTGALHPQYAAVLKNMDARAGSISPGAGAAADMLERPVTASAAAATRVGIGPLAARIDGRKYSGEWSAIRPQTPALHGVTGRGVHRTAIK